jgi:hypothetical protein
MNWTENKIKARSNDYGTFNITPFGEFKACTYTTIVMTYTVGKKGLKEGGLLKIGLPNMGWGEPCTPYARGDYDLYKGSERQICRYKKCNTTCSIKTNTENNTSIYLYHRGSQNILGPYNNWSWWITAVVENGSFSEGDVIEITYGNKSYGEKGAFVQPWVENDRIWFTAFVDLDGTGKFNQVEGSPVICSVSSGLLEKINITIPSIIPTSTSFDIKLSATDWGSNPVQLSELNKITEVTINDSEGKSIINDNTFADKPSRRIKGITANKDIYYWVKIKTKDGNLIANRSNPAIHSNDNMDLFWGDLHSHSFYHQYNEKLGYGDPCTSPDELFKYARDISHLDFVALTDGRGALPDNKGWEESQRMVIENYKEDDFVTFKGWEVQMGTEGHRNAIYRTTDIEPSYDNKVFENANVWMETPKGSMQSILEYFSKRDDILLIPHHSLIWMNWDCYDEKLDRLVEIYSCWGSSEHPENVLWDKSSPSGQSVVEALNRGYKLGFVGGSDSHTGYVGRSISNADRYEFCRYKAGYTAVYAEKCSRESIFDALRNRSCYATTGTRIILKFYVDGSFMGTIVPDAKKAKKHSITFMAVGTNKISSVEIIRNGHVIYSIEPYTDYYLGEWEDTCIEGEKVLYYYLRVTQVDGNMAWSSPVFV